MRDPVLDLGAIELMFGKEGVDIPPQMEPHEIRNLRRHYDLEAAVGYLPAHSIFGAWIQKRAAGDHARACIVFACAAGENDGRSAVTEQSRCDQVGRSEEH